MQVAELVDQFAAQPALRKRLLRRFRAEGIEIPFPARTLHVRKRARRAPVVETRRGIPASKNMNGQQRPDSRTGRKAGETGGLGDASIFQTAGFGVASNQAGC